MVKDVCGKCIAIMSNSQHVNMIMEFQVKFIEDVTSTAGTYKTLQVEDRYMAWR